MIDVLFLVLPETLLLDLAGPAEAFRLANQQLAGVAMPAAFRLRFAGPSSEVASSVGLDIANLEGLPAQLPPRCWVVVPGRPGTASVVRRQRPWLTARDWLARVVAPRLSDETGADAKLLTVCAGALLAADAGLASGRCHPSLVHCIIEKAPHL